MTRTEEKKISADSAECIDLYSRYMVADCFCFFRGFDLSMDIRRNPLWRYRGFVRQYHFSMECRYVGRADWPSVYLPVYCGGIL